MTARNMARRERAIRLLGWTLMAAVCGFLLWIVFGGAAHAEDPKAAARAIGNAGNTAAGAVARDSSNAADVPGYAGTNLPERNIGASRLEDEGRARLADPDDPSGKAGRAVIQGITSRPAASVTASDPAVTRAEGIAVSPQSSAHGADGLASGSTADCGADLQDAEDGGTCGSVRWCVGGDCETVRPEANTGFVNAATRLNMAVELGGEEFDRDNLRFFTGERRACHIKLFGLANCCKNSGLLIGLGNCSAGERELAEERNAGNTHYLGKYCSKRTFFGACIRRSRAWCVFGSKLGRILQQQGRQPARHRLGELPGPDGGRDRGHRLCEPRFLRVHRRPDGRVEGAVGVAAGRGRYRGCDAHAHPRLLLAGAMTVARRSCTP